MNLFDWMARWAKPRDDEQAIKAVLGRLLFSSDEIKKRAKVLSGGEQGRMLFGKLMLQQPNIMILAEPTNHLDMESIEALTLALENYPGTLLFVSHDREFVSSLATRIIELPPHGVVNNSGTYDEYLQRQAEQEAASATRGARKRCARMSRRLARCLSTRTKLSTGARWAARQSERLAILLDTSSFT